MRNGDFRLQLGFTYFGLLFAVGTTALVLGAGATLLGNDLRRDKELELLLAGDEIRRAIESYHSKNTSGTNPYPQQLEWLLRDPNQPALVRHLRRIHRDPMHDSVAGAGVEPQGNWVLIMGAGGQIVGVHSSSSRAPLKTAGFPQQYEAFASAKSYSDWKFIANGAIPVQSNAGATEAPRTFIPAPLSPSAPRAPAPAALSLPPRPGVAGAPSVQQPLVAAPPSAAATPPALVSPVIPNQPVTPADALPVATEPPPAVPPPPAAPPQPVSVGRNPLSAAPPPAAAPVPAAAGVAAPPAGAPPAAAPNTPDPAATPAAPAPPAAPTPPAQPAAEPQQFIIRTL